MGKASQVFEKRILALQEQIDGELEVAERDH